MAKPNGATAERVTVVGAGYVGLVTAASLADLGHQVISMDIDSERIGRLQDGDIPIFEPGLAELVEKNRPRLTFTDDPTVAYADSEFIYICVDTPPTHSGDADLSRVWNVVDNLPPQDGERILVIKSTVPVGTGAVIRNELNRRGYEHIHYSSNPEFLREGTALQDFMRPDRIVVGADDPAVARKVASLYDAIETELVLTNVASAEMIKYASNAFLATKISFINEIANVCEATGADVTTVAHGMGLDPRIGPHFLQAGIGYGGSCFPKDVSALKQLAGNSGYHFQLLTAVIEVNELQKRRVIGKLQKHLGSLVGRRIALLGLAFKPDTDDMRQASSIVLAARLLGEGASVAAYDPVAMEAAATDLDGVDMAASAGEALAGADAAVLVTEWAEFAKLDWAAAAGTMSRPILIDGRNFLDPAAMARDGFVYEGCLLYT